MILALATLFLTLAFAAGPFLVPNFSGFAADLFPVPQQQPPVQPAGWAFAIWGPIYIWLTASAIYGTIWRTTHPEWAEMRAPLILSLAFGAAWLPVAQESPVLAAAMIWAMLATGLVALFRAPLRDRFWAALPLGLYTGWLSAAACVATGLCLAGYGLVSSNLTAQLMLALGTTIAALVQMNLRRAPSYGVAVVWAFAAIYVANTGRNPDVAALAMSCAIAIGAITLFFAVREMLRGEAF